MAGAQLRGGLVLHASAVLLPGGTAAAFIGHSFSGKSTLGALLARHARCTFIADDLVVLEQMAEGYRLRSSDKQPWIRSDMHALLGLSRSRKKKPMRIRERASGAKLSAIVSLRFDDRLAAPKLRRLGAIDAFQRVLSCKVKISFDDRENWQTDVQSVANLVERLAIYECVRPRRVAATQKTIELLLAKLASA